MNYTIIPTRATTIMAESSWEGWGGSGLMRAWFVGEAQSSVVLG